MNTEVSSITALGRLLIALIFIRAGINQLGSVAATAATMRNHGIPYPDILVWGAITLSLIGGLMLVAGLYARWVALALFFYTLSLALIFHAYWTVSDPTAARAEANSFFGHLSMMGGMLFVVAFGAGAYSIDALINRSSTGQVTARRVRSF
ncbi:MAG: DoxX family protein [Xanthobacteraceae bacterium]